MAQPAIMPIMANAILIFSLAVNFSSMTLAFSCGACIPAMFENLSSIAEPFTVLGVGCLLTFDRAVSDESEEF